MNNIESIHIISENCVNSKWTAKWLAKGKQEYCQCPFECKIKVSIKRKNSPPYTYIITKAEYEQLLIDK